MNQYCFNIDIGVPHPLKDPSLLNQTGEESQIWFVEHKDVSIEFVNWLDNNDLILTYPPLIFYTPANGECGIHIDGSKIVDRVTMNWAVQGVGANMHWYKLKNSATITPQEFTQANTPYTQYKSEQVLHVHTQSIAWPSIVQVGVPHRISNHIDAPRWAISCDISLKSAPEQGLTMTEALEIFKKWIIPNK
jgi:hypothetical protein